MLCLCLYISTIKNYNNNIANITAIISNIVKNKTIGITICLKPFLIALTEFFLSSNILLLILSTSSRCSL